MADGSQLGNAFFADFGPSSPPSGGTITGVTAGLGLSGGGTAGQVNIDLETPVSIANGGTGGSTATGTGAVVLANSPVLGGNPQGPTPATADNSQSFATTAFVKNVVAGLPAGTITNVSAGHGLTGGGASGAVTLALATPVAVADGGTGATTVTGTGANVLATSPTLVTPALGTPSAVNLANATNLPTSALAAGVTGAGAVVLASSPALLNTPTAPTAAPGTSTTQLATTAFVGAAVAGLPGGTITAVNPGTGLTGGGASGAVTIGLSTPVAVANGGTGTTTSTGTGSNVLSSGATLANPVFTNPTLGTPASGNLSNCLGLPVAGITGVLTVAQGGTGVTTSTGSGANVLATSPVLVTPALGTPSSGVLSNCTGLSLTTGVTGNLPVANGGTGATTTTGTGANVLGTSPTLTTPTINTTLTLTSAAVATLTVDSPAGNQRIIQFTTANSPRWQFITSAAAESGGNAGSNLVLQAMSDAGAFLFNCMQINRANGIPSFTQGIAVSGAGLSVTAGGLSVTGLTTLATGLSVTGNTVLTAASGNTLAIDGAAGSNRTQAFTTAGSLRWQWTVAGAESGGNAGSNLSLLSYDDTGTSLGSCLGITRSNGITNFVKGAFIQGLPAHGVMLSQGNNVSMNATAAGTAGQVLTSQGAAADPTFTTAVGGSSGTTGQNPTASPSGTGSMAGMGATFAFTPTRNGRVLVTVHGHVTIPAAAAAGAGLLMNLFYGTGTAPANGAASTGTQATPALRAITGVAVTAADQRPFTLIAMLTGLAVGTAYWVDVLTTQGLAAGGVTINNVTFNYAEQ